VAIFLNFIYFRSKTGNYFIYEDCSTFGRSDEPALTIYANHTDQDFLKGEHFNQIFNIIFVGLVVSMTGTPRGLRFKS
jgi:hypothetical protein